MAYTQNNSYCRQLEIGQHAKGTSLCVVGWHGVSKFTQHEKSIHVEAYIAQGEGISVSEIIRLCEWGEEKAGFGQVNIKYNLI